MMLADVPQVPDANVPTLTIVYFVAFVIFGAATTLLFVMMRNARKAYEERVVLRLAVGAGVSGVLAAGALFLFADAIGFIGRVIVGLAIAATLVLVGKDRARRSRGQW